MPTVKIGDVDLYYDVKGTGEVLVFTHGASWDHRQWEPQIEKLSKHYTTITWDVRGHGKSSLPEGPVDSEDFIKDLIGLLEHLNVKRAHLCGLSMGGHISLQTAIKHPEFVASLIVIGTPFTNKFNWFEKVFVPINRWSSKFVPMNVMATIQAKMLSKFNSNNKQYIHEVVSSMPLKNWIRIWNSVSTMESGSALDQIKCPTLILQGDHDNMIERQQQELEKRIPQSKLVFIKNANHATNLDNPAQVNNEIFDFLSEFGGST
ncbi:alpha/beta fold hydrolase [Sporosarcina sp. CAU 1771]